MFLARRPSLETIARFLRESQDLPLSYGPIGIVKAETARRDLDEATFAIGHGKADFERARAALIAWKQFDIGWIETFPRHAAVAVGTVVAVLIRHLGFWSLNGCRVLYSVGCPADDARFGFAYGTLTNHAEAGEELFACNSNRQASLTWISPTVFAAPPKVRLAADDQGNQSRRR